MKATVLWAQASLRRNLAATVALVVLAGVTVGIVGSVFAAAHRSETSLARFSARSRGFDVFVFSCPPGKYPNDFGASQTDVIEICANPEVNERFRREVLADIPLVESSAAGGTGVIAVQDATRPGGQFHGALLYYVTTPGAGGVNTPIVVAGRLAAVDAPDEIVIGEIAARAADIHVGDTVRVASWDQSELDAAIDGHLAPSTPAFESKVVGIVRSLSDVQLSTEGDAGKYFLPGGVFAGPGWSAAHAGSIAGYGTSVAARLTGGPGAQADLEAALKQHDWFTAVDPAIDVDLSALHRSLDVERAAEWIAGGVAGLAAAVLLGLTLFAQLRREMQDATLLRALGMTRRDLALGATLRAATIVVPAGVVAIGIVAVASPIGPYGLAHKIEFDHPVLVDLRVVGLIAVGLVVLGVAAAWLAAERAGRRLGPPKVRSARPLPFGPIVRSGLTFTRGGSARAAGAAVAFGVAACLIAGGMVASLDRVVGRPERYGAWWDVAVGQYSEESSLQPGIDAIKALPGVDAAAGIYDVSSDARVDGVHVPLQAYAVYVGDPEPVMVSGHAPHRPDEIALGRATADRLGKHTGDRVRITNLDGSVDIGDVTVTGIAVLANAVNSAANAGDGAYVTSDVAHQLSPAVAQSIAIRVRPGPTRQATLDRLTAAFPGSIRPASPQADLRNLVRLRSVPWLLASLIGALTLAAVSHVLFGLFRRHRGDLAILGATGLTRRQRLQVMGVSAGWLVLVGIAVGLPVGVVGARVVWQSLAERISIPAHPVVSLPEAGLVVVGVLLLGLSIALVAGRWQQRRTPAAILRTE